MSMFSADVHPALAAHFGDDFLENLAGAVGVFLVGDVDADRRIAGTKA